MSSCFVVSQIGDAKTAERYFQDVEKAYQVKGSNLSHATCVLMNRYMQIKCFAPLGETSVLVWDSLRKSVLEPLSRGNTSAALP